VALGLARSGDAERALELRSQLSAAASAKLLELIADACVLRGDAGRKLLPADLHPGFEAVRSAITHFEAGRDDAARTALEPVGRLSPFAEWRLFLRGLIAWHAGDDTRASDNWNRLDSNRLAARLAAPLRFATDAAFRKAQSPDAAVILTRQADSLSETDVGEWRQVQAALANERYWPRAFRLAATLVPRLRQRRPELLPRVARCFYDGIIEVGGPDDVPRYQKLFGNPPDDPKFDRLRALAYEHYRAWVPANQHWTAYEQVLAADHDRWPGELGRRARALVWERIARNILLLQLESDEDEDGIRSFFVLSEKSKLKLPAGPTVEQALRRSVELAPDRPDAYRLLMAELRRQGQPKQARDFGRRLLERYPDDLVGLQLMAEVASDLGLAEESLELLHKAIRVNPLDRGTLAKLGHAHWSAATAHALKGRLADADREYDAALSRIEDRWRFALLAARSIAARKAGDPAAAAEWRTRALGRPEDEQAVTWWLVVEAARQKLPRSEKQPLDKALAELLDRPDPATLSGLLPALRLLREREIDYLGRKTHEKKVMSAFNAAVKAKLPAVGRRLLCRALLDLKAHRLLRLHATAGREAFPKDPFFPYYLAESHLLEGDHAPRLWQVGRLLDEAAKLVNRDRPEEAELLQTIQGRQKEWQPQDPLRMFERFFGGSSDDEAEEG
jgi:tetratricopeptide (TPR) repeat protein